MDDQTLSQCLAQQMGPQSAEAASPQQTPEPAPKKAPDAASPQQTPEPANSQPLLDTQSMLVDIDSQFDSLAHLGERKPAGT